MEYVVTRVFKLGHREEIADPKICAQMLKECLNEMKKKKITKVILFRDGVGQGQIDLVKKNEIINYVNILGDQIRLTVILVTKRINIRFAQQDSLNNPVIGTVIDGVGTMEGKDDFFMISQTGNIGTLKPTYYEILHNDLKISKDDIEILTFSLTFLIPRASNTCGLPAIVFFAHLAAYRARNYARNFKDEKIVQTLNKLNDFWFL